MLLKKIFWAVVATAALMVGAAVLLLAIGVIGLLQEQASFIRAQAQELADLHAGQAEESARLREALKELLAPSDQEEEKKDRGNDVLDT